MVFSSIIFLFFFLPFFLLVFHFLKSKTQLVFLLFSSLLFYFWGENLLIWILLLTTVIDFFCGLIISDGFKKDGPVKLESGGKHTRRQKFGLAFSIFSNLSLLAYFKYANFFVDNAKHFLSIIGINAPVFDNFTAIVLPLGISFYTFQSMSYTIDVYQGKIKANRNFIQFASFVTMFPQLVAGPIVRYRDIESQMIDHRITADDVVCGIKRFIIGLSKKVIIANTMASVADKVFALPPGELTMGVAWLGIIAYSLQIYFDFSGYSCMAIGLGKMIGFTFPENFNYPYISRSIQEFWRRWHISLSTWFRDYLYIPLGGNRKGELLTYRNLIIVFFLCGLWHGASWNFIVWGLFHGFFLVVERTRFKYIIGKFPPILQNIYVLMIVMIGWVFFRTESLHDAIQYIGTLFGLTASGIQFDAVMGLVNVNVVVALIMGILFSMPLYGWIEKRTISMSVKYPLVFNLAYLSVLVSLFGLCTVALATNTYNPFIYFRF
jgi:alginate O-acetyltransferase complex protein AlgI